MKTASGLELLWSVKTEEYLSETCRMVSWKDRLIVPAGGILTALEKASGETIWSLCSNRGDLHATAAGDVLVAAGAYDDVFGISPEVNHPLALSHRWPGVRSAGAGLRRCRRIRK
jgi:hypothetical protein